MIVSTALSWLALSNQSQHCMMGHHVAWRPPICDYERHDYALVNALCEFLKLSVTDNSSELG
jgi:hypothetical protein